MQKSCLDVRMHERRNKKDRQRKMREEVSQMKKVTVGSQNGENAWKNEGFCFFQFRIMSNQIAYAISKM